MIMFKACWKCAGDLYLEQDLGDTDFVCLQCGYRRTVRTWSDGSPIRGRSGDERELEEVRV